MKKQVQVPENLQALSEDIKNNNYYDLFYKICTMSGGKKEYGSPIVVREDRGSWSSYVIDRDNIVYDGNEYSKNHSGNIFFDVNFTKMTSSENGPDYKYDQFETSFLGWFDENGAFWVLPFSVSAAMVYVGLDVEDGNLRAKPIYKPNLHLDAGSWTVEHKLFKKMFFLNPWDEIEDILLRTNPYGYAFAQKEGLLFSDILMMPAIELLHKSGYFFGDNVQPENVAYFNRLVQNGSDLGSIFKTPKFVYETLKGEDDLRIWDLFRKMAKTGKLTKEDVRKAYHAGYNSKEFSLISDVLKFKYENNPVFSFSTLQRYLERVDMYQAIYPEEALTLLKDYLLCCKALQIKPRIDSDSLKREHDVAARCCRIKRDERMAKRMQGACEYLKKFNYSEERFFVRGIRDYDDLIDEANQQGNCLAGFAESIINKESMIYVMREKSAPDKSLITVELTESGDVRHAFLSYNREIRDPAQSEFLKRWEQFAKSRIA